MKTSSSTSTELMKSPYTTILRADKHYEPLQRTKNIRTFYGKESNYKEIVETITELVTNKKIKVISYDVFDTALLRECKSEAGRFWDISKRFITHLEKEKKQTPFSAEDVFLARTTAAKAAYTISPSFSGNREGRFEDIARTTCELIGHPHLTSSYIENELLYENETLTKNPLIDILEKSLPNIRQIFISDMYLEGDKITHLLMEKFGTKVAGRVYSSADGFGSKRTGGIFSYVENVLGLKGEDILHVGDSLHSDYQMPRKHGWNTFYLPLPNSEKQKRRDCYSSVEKRFNTLGISLQKHLQFNL